MLTSQELSATGESITAAQLPSGMIQWFEGGHADPWNHVEAAMALVVTGHKAHAEKAYEWLRVTQEADGSWFNYYVGNSVEDYRKDTNVCAYVATGVLHFYLATKDMGFVEEMWPTVRRAIDFVVSHQRPEGTVSWCTEPDGAMGKFALLTGSSSISHSIGCALALSALMGKEQPEWDSAKRALDSAIAEGDFNFEPKRRWAMDWYYPALCGALDDQASRDRIGERWSEFVEEGVGVRCVSDQAWVTAAETAELVMTLDRISMTAEGESLFRWIQFMREPDGSYFTGWALPEKLHFPGGERSTYTAGAMVLAWSALWGTGKESAIFRLKDDLVH